MLGRPYGFSFDKYFIGFIFRSDDNAPTFQGGCDVIEVRTLTQWIKSGPLQKRQSIKTQCHPLRRSPPFGTSHILLKQEGKKPGTSHMLTSSKIGELRQPDL